MANQAKVLHYIPVMDMKKFVPKQVVVYARVSRRGEMKHHSIEMQKEHLKRDIENHPGWNFAGLYVDEGITGTKLDRAELDRLLRDAKAGRVDIIVTKTVSRLGRNNREVAKMVQELKLLGVTIVFDAEGFSTADPDYSIKLQFLGIQAEMEAEKNSNNQKWAIRYRFSQGIPYHARMYGYYTEGHKLITIPEEAEIVKLIFNSYLSGMGQNKISKLLNERGIRPLSGKLWQSSSIRDILINPKYTGDQLLQRYYRTDYLTKRKKRNKGELPQYVVEDTHEPIIDKTTFNMVQEEIARRGKKYNGFKSQGEQSEIRPFTRILYCQCGKSCRYKHYKTRDVWLCPDHYNLGNAACTVKPVREDILIATTKEVLASHVPKFKADELTHELISKYIRRIIMLPNQKLEYRFRDGNKVTKVWEYKSRKESWSDEMKKEASKKAKIREANKRVKGD